MALIVPAMKEDRYCTVDKFIGRRFFLHAQLVTRDGHQARTGDSDRVMSVVTLDCA